MTYNLHITKASLNRIDGEFQLVIANDSKIDFFKTRHSKQATVGYKALINERIVFDSVKEGDVDKTHDIGCEKSHRPPPRSLQSVNRNN
jgi:hypothetical protein